MKSMNPVSQNPARSRSLEDLQHRHQVAVKTAIGWQEVWELFYRNRWFRQTLLIAARKAVRRSGLKRDCVDDVRQEALIEFSRSLQRRTSLGFDPTRGNFAAFVGLIVHRCCLKALRQFRHQYLSLHQDGWFHPYYEEHSQIEKIMDLKQAASELQEPYRSLVRQICAGVAIDEIAQRSKRSRRTIYRWLDRAIELLKIHYAEE
jgi:RNA polymerase sigma factor (sigma-70 family)